MKRAFLILAVLILSPATMAELKMSSVFGDHMVIQQKQPVHIWGWTTTGQNVTVSFEGQTTEAKAGDDGRFDVMLKPVAAGGPYELSVKADETRTFKDVLVGEVWICSGQSNMAWPVSNSNDSDLETMAAKYPKIRLISVPQVGTQEPQKNFEGAWQECTPETVKTFSAVGYYFGRQLHQTLDVPVGLIDNAWGGSACEAWVRRDLLHKNPELYGPLLEKWTDLENTYDHEAAMEQYKKRLAKWQQTKKGNRPRPPRNQLAGQHRPANLYNGVLKPILGYTIRGTIWYQGESNAGRAYQYRHLFPLMISSWRDEWGQGDFPFYWVQLADYLNEKPEPAESTWAELREAQTMTHNLPNTGEAVIIDLGESHDIHPRNKQIVARRLARLALHNEYDIDIVHRSPIYRSMERVGSKVHVHFDEVGGGLDTFDVREPIGFAIAQADQKFVVAKAKIVDRNTMEVWAEGIQSPVAVRYAWADNPVCNVQNREGLPLTPFRTDDWPGLTVNVLK